MRGLLLIGSLIALAVVAYLHMNSATTVMESDTATNKIEQVEQDVNAIMQQRMQDLQKQSQD